jgi:hypothetical protein
MPAEKISLKGEKENGEFKAGEDRLICSSIK